MELGCGSRLGANPMSAGGTITGDLVITGDLTVEQNLTVTLDTEITAGTLLIDFDAAEAMLVRKDGDAGDVFAVNTSSPAVTIGGGVATTVAINTNEFILDSSGNVGIGVTPESWNVVYKGVQFGGTGALIGAKTVNPGGSVGLGNNVYYGTNWQRIIGTGGSPEEASYYSQINGTHIFRVAGTGIADSVISWTTAPSNRACG